MTCSRSRSSARHRTQLCPDEREPDLGIPEPSVVSQNRSRKHAGKGSQTRRKAGAEGLGVGGRRACGQALGEAGDLSACGDLCLYRPRSSRGSEGVSDTDALEIEFMDLYGFNGDRCKRR